MPQLRFHIALTLALIVTTLSAPAQQSPSTAAPASPAPTPDQAQLLKTTEAFVRNLFAWGPDFAVKLGPLAPSASADFYTVPLSVTVSGQTDTGTVFVSKDGKTFLRGEMFDMAADPFAANRKKLTVEGNPSLGPANAKITVVEFSDFQCPHCRELYETLKTVIPEHPDVRFVFKDYPLTQIHPWAETAAIGARCAFIQSPDAYFKIQSQIFDNQDLISAANVWDKLNEFAATDALDAATFKSCLSSKEGKDAVDQSRAEAESLNVTSTPTLFINGRPAPGPDKSTLTQFLTFTPTPTPKP
jgi:protein-disulfide isomerase